jgi:hypothetical protein
LCGGHEMNRFENIVKNCDDAIAQYQFKSNYAFESGYYKLQVQSLCKEIEFLQQELESTIEQIKEITKDLA